MYTILPEPWRYHVSPGKDNEATVHNVSHTTDETMIHP